MQKRGDLELFGREKKNKVFEKVKVCPNSQYLDLLWRIYCIADSASKFKNVLNEEIVKKVNLKSWLYKFVFILYMYVCTHIYREIWSFSFQKLP